jgi:hypothetical protein
MRWWKQWKRGREAWVDRKRRFQKLFAEKNQESAAEKAAVLAGETGADAAVRAPERGEG